MRITLTRFGWPQVLVLPAIVLAVMAALLPAASVLPSWVLWLLEGLLTAILMVILAFFRDPRRTPPADKNLLLAPADGKVTCVEKVQEGNFIKGPAIRIYIFMNIFNVHINRCPCNARVEKITHRPGRHKNAMAAEAARVNESNELWLTRTDQPQDKLIVRQIAGAVARRIVCTAGEGQTLTAGEKFGMIKFGSGTDLYLPAREDVKILVKRGDKVKAGLSPLARYEQ